MNKKQLRVIAILVFVFLLVGGALGYYTYQDTQKREKDQQVEIKANSQLKQEETPTYIEITGNPSEELHALNPADIKSVILKGETGGANGSHEHTFSETEIESFIDLIHKVQLGDSVSEEKAWSNGAISYYTITTLDNSILLISPGEYFKVNDYYYQFSNMDELWSEFVSFNSLR